MSADERAWTVQFLRDHAKGYRHACEFDMARDLESKAAAIARGEHIPTTAKEPSVPRPFDIVNSIRKVEGGYIVEARDPYGGVPAGFGEVICVTFDEVIKLLRKCAMEDVPWINTPPRTIPAGPDVEAAAINFVVAVEEARHAAGTPLGEEIPGRALPVIAAYNSLKRVIEPLLAVEEDATKPVERGAP